MRYDKFFSGDKIFRANGRRGILINPLARNNIKLYHADLFDFDISPYDAFYLHIAFPFAGNQDEIPEPHQFDTPYAERLRKKLEGLKSGSLIIMGPVRLEGDFGAAYFTREIGEVILKNMKRLDLNFPDEVSHYEVYQRP